MKLKVKKSLYGIQMYGFWALTFILFIASALPPVNLVQQSVYTY